MAATDAPFTIRPVAVAEAAALAPAGAQLAAWDDLAAIPPFSEDECRTRGA